MAFPFIRTHISILSMYLLLFTVCFAVDPSENYPSPSISPSLPDFSPPAPPPSDGSSPAPSPATKNSSTTQFPSPAPTPEAASGVNHDNHADFGNLKSDESSGGHKAGIAFGVIALACFFGIGAIVYRKRRENIRRSQCGYLARRDFL